MGRRSGRGWTKAATFAFAAFLACGRRASQAELTSPSPERRAVAVAALATSRSEADLPALLVAQRDPSALVRKAAAGAFTARGGPRAVEALGALLADEEPEVAIAAARGLVAMPHERRVREILVDAYGRAAPITRAEIATSLEAIGVSLREAVGAEARRIWERNVSALERGSRAERVGAAEEQGRSRRVDAVQRLLPLLDPERRADAALAAAAARGIGAAGDRSARPALEELLEEDDPRLAEAAADALGALGDPAASQALARAATRRSGRVAAAAMDAVSRLPPAFEVGVAACEIAVRAFDPAVAAAAARQARQREAACPERALAARLARPGPVAAGALGALGALGLAGDRLKAPAQRALGLLGAADATLRARAATALGEAGVAAAAPLLARRAQALVQKLAEARQTWIPPGPASAALPPEWVEDGDPGDAEELASIVVALARLRAEGAGTLLASLTADPSDVVRCAVAESLAHLRSEDAAARLARALEDPSSRVRVKAAEALGGLGPAAVPALSAAAQRSATTDPDLAFAIARALGDTGSPEAVPALSRLLATDAAPAAAAGLGRIATKGAAPGLIDLLQRPGARARLAAIDALGQIGAAEAGATLTAELTSDRPEVRAAAARALGRIRHDAASSKLEALRGDYFGEVRRAAIEALAKLPVRPVGRR